MSRALIDEAWRRFGPGLQQKEASGEAIRGILSTRFDKQVAFVTSPALRKADRKSVV